MVNYVLSFCKITGASKIFTRHFYLPLLKPQTPREALRTLRITGKWLLGAKIQHYIPVLLNHKRKRSEDVEDYGKKIHQEMDDYNYMCPVIDFENENHKILTKILETKNGEGVFVYTVEDRKYNIILEAQFELAIRDGDIIDVLVSQKNDKIIVKLKDFKKIPMEVQYYNGTNDIYYGEGATTEDEEQFHHHGKYTMSIAKIFEDKERFEEEWEEHLRRLIKRRRKQKGEGSKEWKNMIKETMKNFDWQKFEEDAKKVIDEINQPATEEDIEMDIDDLEATKHVNETILEKGEALLNKLPSLGEIPEVIKSMENATLCEIGDDGSDSDEKPSDEMNKKRRVSGVKVTLPSGKECFISGQMVHTDEGEVFVPGQTVENENGLEYAPGITINIDNQPTLITGLIMGEEERPPMFLPAQSTITSDGQLTFATVPEERPQPPPEVIEKRIVKRKKRKAAKQTIDEIPEEEIIQEPPIVEQFEAIIEALIVLEQEHEEEEEEEGEEVTTSSDNNLDSDDKSSVELNSSELEELDIEAIRIKQEQQRLEMEKLKQILMDDGMDELIANLEDKKAKLQQKLEEMRKLSVNFENNLITYVSESDAIDIASKISDNKETINRMVEIMLTLTRRASAFRDKNSINADNIHQPSAMFECLNDTDERFNKCSNKVKVLLRTALVAANEVYKTRPKDQVLAFNELSDIIVDILKNDETALEDVMEIMNTPVERNEVCNTVLRQLTQNVSKSKTFMLQEIINKKKSDIELYDCVTKLLDKSEDNMMSSAFEKLLKVDDKILPILTRNLKENSSRVSSENKVNEILKSGIIRTVRGAAEAKLADFENTHSEEKIIEFIEEAKSFARALDLENVHQNLATNSLQYGMKTQQYDKQTTEHLKRVFLMKQLADKDYSLKNAINRIKKDPDRAKSDPRIRQLIRESAVLTSEASPLKSSKDIPLNIMKKQNLLAIEDYLVQKGAVNFPVLINRGNFQAVIPKEAAKSVLAGRVPYVLVDEDGVTNFKPMHMLSAIKGNQNRDKRFEDYLGYGVRERSADREDRHHQKAKTNVRKLKKLLSNRSVA